MRLFAASVCAVLMASALPALAEFQQVTSKNAFMNLVSGKTLTRPLVKIQVLPNGSIEGTGAAWDVSGNWTWENGYLCRSLEWGGDDLGYNCQEVRANGNRVRITSDKGTGQSADFRLR
ncbi:MAG: dihydrodipicolinate reductase [Pseudomonadota bacterium]